MPFCATKTWNFPSYTLILWKNFRMSSPKILLLLFLFAYIFPLPLIFTLLGSLLTTTVSHFLTSAMKFSCLSSNEIGLRCFQSLALALSLLLTWVYFKKYRRKRLDFVVDHAISCQINLELHMGCHTCWLSYFHWCACGADRRADGRTNGRVTTKISPMHW